MKDEQIKKITRGETKYDGMLVEDAIKAQLADAAEAMRKEIELQRRYRHIRSIRAAGKLNVEGGCFVFDIRLLAQSDMAEDEVLEGVVKIAERGKK
jgi:hypothetical protein